MSFYKQNDLFQDSKNFVLRNTAVYLGIVLFFDIAFFAILTTRVELADSEARWIVPSLFALGASQIVSVVLWNWSGIGQMVKWCMALLGMFVFSFWLNRYMDSGWSQMWMICCLLVVSARLIWGLIELQKQNNVDSIGAERFVAQDSKYSFRIWNFFEWTVAAGLILSVVNLIYQNILASVLPVIGILAFGFVCALSRLASVIVADHYIKYAVDSTQQSKKNSSAKKSFGVWDSAGTILILLMVNVAGYFWLKRSLSHFYDQSMNFIFLVAVIAQVWQLVDGVTEKMIKSPFVLNRIKASRMEPKSVLPSAAE